MGKMIDKMLGRKPKAESIPDNVCAGCLQPLDRALVIVDGKSYHGHGCAKKEKDNEARIF